MIRRALLKNLMALAAWSLLAPAGRLAARQKSAPQPEGQPFSKEWLRETAQRLASSPYQPPEDALPDWVADLNWDTYNAIRFRPERALWAGDRLPFQARMFHLGLFYKHPIALYEVARGMARPIPYDPGLFDLGSHSEEADEDDLGFAGFRVHARSDLERDLFSFLGASYFRAVGASRQYGLSARGLAVDTGLPRPEEFPEFRSFWLERPGDQAERLVIHALLDSPSVAGAYTFEISPGDATVMDIQARLYPRKAIERIGIAPLTSMFQHGENDRRVSDDFRPEIHDSDGLSLHTGSDEWVWRPLVNSPVVRVNSFFDRNPRGFGLLQRDRDFDHYHDDTYHYHQRPSAWVEPLGEWGAGSVQLVEIPTGDETFDNIVAFWNPAEAFAPGQERNFRYRLTWGAEPASRPGMAEVAATRIGAGGVPGQRRQAPQSRKFVVDFTGGRLSELPESAKVEPVISASRGQIKEPAAHRVNGTRLWRCHFDLASEGAEPVDLRCFLRDERGALTETWLYQWTPQS